MSTGELCNAEAEVMDVEAREAVGYTACVRVSGDTETAEEAEKFSRRMRRK